MTFKLNDSFRTVKPQETLERLQKLFNLIGITRVADVTHLERFYGIYVSNCIRPNSQNLSVAQGKGSSLELSQISAIMESIEAYHMENQSPPSFRGKFNQNLGHNLINPEELYLTEFNAPLEEIEFDWIPVENIIDKKIFYIPASFVKINTSIPNIDYLYFNVSSNGLAAGNSKDEALSHAICEIIERDSLTKWQSKTIEQRDNVRVDPSTVKDFNLEFIDNLYKNNLKLKIWDITSDLRVPSYQVAIIDNHSLRSLNVFTGSGAHLSREIALFRAISEAIQGRLTYISGIRDDIFGEYYKNMRLNNNKLVTTSSTKEGKNYQDCTSIETGSISNNLTTLLDILIKHGYQQVLVYEHTKKELGIPVVHVFIPGMQRNVLRM